MHAVRRGVLVGGPDRPQRTQSATPTAVVSDLAARFDGEVPGLTVTRPTLEDVYLEMIGMTEGDELESIGTTP